MVQLHVHNPGRERDPDRDRHIHDAACSHPGFSLSLQFYAHQYALRARDASARHVKIGMAIMFNLGMAAVRAVFVRVVLMNVTTHVNLLKSVTFVGMRKGVFYHFNNMLIS